VFDAEPDDFLMVHPGFGLKSVNFDVAEVYFMWSGFIFKWSSLVSHGRALFDMVD
jgi:hypothetical protein